MMWGNNKNYMDNPCYGCKKERISKVNGKYIRCDMNCKSREKWLEQREETIATRTLKCDIADALRSLEHKRCTTRIRKAV